MTLVLKNDFVEKYEKLTDFKEYERIINQFSTKSIRINTLKTNTSKAKKSLSKRWVLKKIPWNKEGFWIKSERRDIGNTYEHQIGYIYVQEAASMIPPLVLNPNEHDIVLDAAAAPGSKTTQMAAIMKNKGLVIANDVTYYRMQPLVHNLQRCGVLNAITTIMDARKINFEFNKILLDAPCSGTGTIRGDTQNSKYSIHQYSQQLIRTMSGIQKKLIMNMYKNLKPGGTLVYSTCSLDPEEDEEVIQYLLNESDAKLEKSGLKIKSDVNLDYNSDYSSELKKCIKLWPQFYDTAGFFIAKIRKP